MISLPPRKKRKERETDMVGRTLVAMQRITGVRPARNNNGVLTDITGRPVYYGLGNGSPDIVAIITFGGGHRSAIAAYAHLSPVAFAYGIECKMLGKTRSPDQIAWHESIEPWGMRVDTVYSDEAAREATLAEIERLRVWTSWLLI